MNARCLRVALCVIISCICRLSLARARQSPLSTQASRPTNNQQLTNPNKNTNKKVETEGEVATAFTLARILSNVPPARGGPTSLVIFDIHALQVCC